MKEYTATIAIHAPTEAIWAILTDASAYPQFDPTCERVDGRIAVGEKIKVWSKLSPGRAFPVKVTEIDRGHRMTWSGGMPLGLFRGVRTFTTTTGADGAVAVTIHERFTGPMLALIGKSIPDLSEPFHQFVEGLKKRAEATVAA